ncbi:hypothetical protein [Winogradskya consettensis]|nr:hypothetical protein [Actinoplanes consettensis]
MRGGLSTPDALSGLSKLNEQGTLIEPPAQSINTAPGRPWSP